MRQQLLLEQQNNKIKKLEEDLVISRKELSESEAAFSKIELKLEEKKRELQKIRFSKETESERGVSSSKIWFRN